MLVIDLQRGMFTDVQQPRDGEGVLSRTAAELALINPWRAVIPAVPAAMLGAYLWSQAHLAAALTPQGRHPQRCRLSAHPTKQPQRPRQKPGPHGDDSVASLTRINAHSWVRLKD